jgi:serine phosphatase RsbU (regulator of sigma subunit)
MPNKRRSSTKQLRDICRSEISGWFRGLLFAAPAIRVEGTCQPKAGACGDYLGIYRFSRNRLAIVVADACGHGFRASTILEMAAPVDLLENAEELSPSRILSGVSEILLKSEAIKGGEFITACLAIVDCESGIVDLALAGHPPPVLLRDGQAIEREWPAGLPLGVLEDVGAVDIRFTLKPGDRMAIFTDGVVDSGLCGGDWTNAKSTVLDALAASDSPGRLNSSLQSAGPDWVRDDTSAVFVKFGPAESL